MKCATQILLTAILACWLSFACAQQELEIIELKGKTVEQILPVLRPLLEPGATLSGMNNQLFLRASARNRREIRQALQAIDRPARQVLIRVSQQREAESDRRGLSAQGEVVLGTTRRSSVDARVWDSRTTRRDSGGQMVRAQEGSPAFIQVGHSLPLPMRQIVVTPAGTILSETVVYQDVGQGFYAVPRLNGNLVTLDISQQADLPGQYGRGSTNTQRISTTVSGHLGEWIELGGAGQQVTQQQGGSWNSSTREVNEQRSVWLRVEEVE